jgi:hypothetical protein
MAEASASISGEFSVPRKSNVGMIIGVAVAICAVIGVGVAIKFAMGGDQGSSTASDVGKQATAAQAKSKNDIPPPSDEVAAPSSTGPLTQDIPVAKPGTLPKATADQSPPPQTQAPTPPSRPAAVAAAPPQPPQPPRAQTFTSHPASPPPAAAPAKPSSKGGGNSGGGGNGGIVRDTPF